MKRGVFDVLRRGLDNTIANWPVILIRLGESLLFGLIAILSAIAIVVPIVVSAGIHLADIGSPEDLAQAMGLMAQKWILLVWVLAAILVLLLVFLLVHSFVQAGCARVAVDGDRIAGPAADGPRSRFHVFSMQRWLAGATDGWWTLFWIYNLAWGVAGLIMLIPLLPTMVFMLLFRNTPEVALGGGCVGLVVSVAFIVPVAIVTGMWTTRATAGWALRRDGARDAVSAGWRALRGDFLRHFLIALAIFVVAVAGSSFFASFSFFAAFGRSLGESATFNIAVIPLRLASSIASSAFSAAVATWFLAAYGALAVEE